MGFLDDESEEEVEIKASENKQEEAELKNEVESKFGSSTSNQSSTSTDKVDLEDLHRQNEKIISMLEQLTGPENNSNEDDISEGGLDGVL